MVSESGYGLITPPGFFASVDSNHVKVLCLDALLQVLILHGLGFFGGAVFCGRKKRAPVGPCSFGHKYMKDTLSVDYYFVQLFLAGLPWQG
jgi:hypothetical protein